MIRRSSTATVSRKLIIASSVFELLAPPFHYYSLVGAAGTSSSSSSSSSTASSFLRRIQRKSSSSGQQQQQHQRRMQEEEQELRRLQMLDTDQLAQEVDRFGRHTPDADHTRRLVHELMNRGAAVNPRLVREAIAVAHRCKLYSAAVDLFLSRVHTATDLERNMLGLPEEVVECAALSEVGDPVQKILAVTRSVEPILRRAPSVDVVAGIEFALFRALWRCFVCLKKLRLSTPLEHRRAGDELDVTEAARRIFDLVRIVNTRVLVSGGRRMDESAAFKQLARAATLCVLYSEKSDDGEADFFRLVNSRRWLQADVSQTPSARYSSLIRTCAAARRHDIASGYFEEFERIYILRKSSSSTVSPDGEDQQQAFPLPPSPVSGQPLVLSGAVLCSINSHTARQLNYVLHAYWSLLNNCEEYRKVANVLDRYLSSSSTGSSSSAAPLLSPSVIALAMRAVGETRESGLAAKAMSSLMRSSSAASSSGGRRGEEEEDIPQQQQAADDGNEAAAAAGGFDSDSFVRETPLTMASKRYSAGKMGSVRPPSSYEMATCLLALAKCGHPSFHRALETCLQERLVEESPLRVAELNLQYALNDPVECLHIVKAEAARCRRLPSGAVDILSDARCASLILQILLRADHPSYLTTLVKASQQQQNQQGRRKTRLQAAWIDWLIIWAQRRRYELTNSQRVQILDLVEQRAPSTPILALQAKLIARDLEKGDSAAASSAEPKESEKQNQQSSENSDPAIVVQSDPRCSWPRRRTALTGLVQQRTASAGECVAESLVADPTLSDLMQRVLQMQRQNESVEAE